MKFPRTYHLPLSPGATSDDKRLSSDECFYKKYVVVTEKMDGENTCMTHDGMHARSESSKDHPSRHFLKAIHASIADKIPKDLAIFGENLYAKHSIKYENLPNNAFLVFAVIDLNTHMFLDWSMTVNLADQLGLETVPLLWEGVYDSKSIQKAIPKKSKYGPDIEGYVVRSFSGFDVDLADHNVAKWVRSNHIQTDKHWTTQWIPNGRIKA